MLLPRNEPNRPILNVSPPVWPSCMLCIMYTYPESLACFLTLGAIEKFHKGRVWTKGLPNVGQKGFTTTKSDDYKTSWKIGPAAHTEAPFLGIANWQRLGDVICTGNTLGCFLIKEKIHSLPTVYIQCIVGWIDPYECPWRDWNNKPHVPYCGAMYIFGWWCFMWCGLSAFGSLVY